jgi:hypothetical protein
MTTFVEPFFQVGENATALQQLLNKLPNQKALSEDPSEVAPYLRVVLEIMLGNTKKFDESCQVNIKWIGAAFISSAKSYPPDGDDSKYLRTDLFTSVYRFLCELEFSMPESLSMELRAVKNFVENHIDEFKGQAKQQLIYANYLMPAQILKHLLHHPNIAAMQEFNAGQKSAQTLKIEWDKEFEAKRNQVELLKNQLDGLETGFNFVGLVDGFRRLSEKKIKEKNFAFACLLGLGACVLAPIISEVVFIVNNLASLDKYKSAILFAIPPAIALELLLVYFFRVVLIHFKSIKAQLLQIELRTALCQFIQSYSTYASGIKEKSSSALDKFESLIFSGLISNEENLPSTFDGTDQLAKLIAGLRK